MKVYVLIESRFHAPNFVYGVYASHDEALEERAKILSELEYPCNETFNNNTFIHEHDLKKFKGKK